MHIFLCLLKVVLGCHKLGWHELECLWTMVKMFDIFLLLTSLFMLHVQTIYCIWYRCQRCQMEGSWNFCVYYSTACWTKTKICVDPNCEDFSINVLYSMVSSPQGSITEIFLKEGNVHLVFKVESRDVKFWKNNL